MTKKNEGQEPAFPFVHGKDFEDSNAGEICNGMSLKTYACIHLKVPKTGKAWLDALITESLRNEMAGRTIYGVLATFGYINSSTVTKDCFNIADAMLSKGKREDENE